MPLPYAVAQQSHSMPWQLYVTKKLRDDMLDPGDIVPKYLEVPGRGKVIQVPTRVIELAGEIRLESDSPDK